MAWHHKLCLIEQPLLPLGQIFEIRPESELATTGYFVYLCPFHKLVLFS